MNAPPSPLLPDMQRFRDLLQATALQGFDVLPIEHVRSHARDLRLPWNSGGAAMLETHEAEAAGVKYRFLCPSLAARSQDPVFFLHGGGWSLFDIDTHDRIARTIASTSDRPVFSLDYPRAPEATFPAGLNAIMDVLVALRASRAGAWGGVSLCGDSAGANLALATALRLRDMGWTLGPLALFYGIYDCDLERASYAQFGGGLYPLSTARMAWYWRNYVPIAADRLHPYAAPLRAELRGLPPTMLIVADNDVLRDENLELAARMRAAGCVTVARVYPGTIHAFIEAGGAIGSVVAERAIGEAGEFLAMGQLALDHRDFAGRSDH